MNTFAKKPESDEDRKRHIDEELDEALEETFPASDPIEPPHQENEPRRLERTSQKD
jgi:hypothetical protein